MALLSRQIRGSTSRIESTYCCNVAYCTYCPIESFAYRYSATFWAAQSVFPVVPLAIQLS
jgi:hypothetical protein